MEMPSAMIAWPHGQEFLKLSGYVSACYSLLDGAFWLDWQAEPAVCQVSKMSKWKMQPTMAGSTAILSVWLFNSFQLKRSLPLPGVRVWVNEYGRGLRIFCLLTNKSTTMLAHFTFKRSGTEAVMYFHSWLYHMLDKTDFDQTSDKELDKETTVLRKVMNDNELDEGKDWETGRSDVELGKQQKMKLRV